MQISYYAARANLYYLWQQHPDWSHAHFAAALGRSKSWVEKWLKRLREELDAGERLEDVLQGHSRARKTPPGATHPLVVETILSIRDEPREGLRRVPGPAAIHYYLERDPLLQFFQLPVPSCTTIYRVLKSHDRIVSPHKHVQQPMKRPAPMTCWQIDFKDVSSIPADPEGKQQHVVETLNIIDTGTSLLLEAHVRSDFTAETALQALALTLAKYGRPKRITLDRDPRWVGSPAGSDFPAALVRFGACLGIDIHICDPHHPQQNGFVERYNRTYQEECLSLDRPADLSQAKAATEAFVQHYNVERPHQGLSCGNRPPRTAFPTLASLPALPSTVDPDSWLSQLDGLHLERKVDGHGMVSIDLKRYYVSSQLVGHHVVLHLDAKGRCMQVLHEQQVVKSLPLKGMVGQVLSYEQFLTHMLHQARAQARLRSLSRTQVPHRRFRRSLAPRCADTYRLTMWVNHTLAPNPEQHNHWAPEKPLQRPTAKRSDCKFGRGTLPALCTGSRGQADGTFGHIRGNRRTVGEIGSTQSFSILSCLYDLSISFQPA